MWADITSCTAWYASSASFLTSRSLIARNQPDQELWEQTEKATVVAVLILRWYHSPRHPWGRKEPQVYSFRRMPITRIYTQLSRIRVPQALTTCDSSFNQSSLESEDVHVNHIHKMSLTMPNHAKRSTPISSPLQPCFKPLAAAHSYSPPSTSSSILATPHALPRPVSASHPRLPSPAYSSSAHSPDPFFPSPV